MHLFKNFGSRVVRPNHACPMRGESKSEAPGSFLLVIHNCAHPLMHTVPNGSFYDHFLSWYNRRLDADVLFLFFEDLKADLKGSVRKIAKFMSTKEHDFTGEELINAVVEKSSFAFMHEHKGQFDEKLSKLARNEACGLAPDAGLQYSKIRAGEAGGGKLKLSTELQEMISERWSKQMLPATGCASYDLVRQKVCAE